jgi:hypothetical protein
MGIVQSIRKYVLAAAAALALTLPVGLGVGHAAPAQRTSRC